MVVITMAVIVVETVALGLAAWSSGSAALFALTAQSVAGLVVEGCPASDHLRSGRLADDRHPLGYGREAYFWSLFAALAIFLGGVALSLGEAWRTLGEERAGELRGTSDPIVVTVVLDNATSVAGTVLALLGLALHQATGAPVFDALASAGIGVLLIVVAAALLRGDVSSSLVAQSRRRRSSRSSWLSRPPRASTRSSTSRQSSLARARSS